VKARRFSAASGEKENLERCSGTCCWRWCLERRSPLRVCSCFGNFRGFGQELSDARKLFFIESRLTPNAPQTFNELGGKPEALDPVTRKPGEKAPSVFSKRILERLLKRRVF
jgi:hypothetical protein